MTRKQNLLNFGIGLIGPFALDGVFRLLIGGDFTALPMPIGMIWIGLMMLMIMVFVVFLGIMPWWITLLVKIGKGGRIEHQLRHFPRITD